MLFKILRKLKHCQLANKLISKNQPAVVLQKLTKHIKLIIILQIIFGNLKTLIMKFFMNIIEFESFED